MRYDDSHKIVYLLVEVGTNGNKKTIWKSAGRAYVCRDGSFNVKLDIHPGLTFNIRDYKSNSEREEAEGDMTFVCADCVKTYHDEEAHALVIGGAVCDGCYGDYKDCPKCSYAFPKHIASNICGKCRVEGKQ